MLLISDMYRGNVSFSLLCEFHKSLAYEHRGAKVLIRNQQYRGLQQLKSISLSSSAQSQQQKGYILVWSFLIMSHVVVTDASYCHFVY